MNRNKLVSGFGFIVAALSGVTCGSSSPTAPSIPSPTLTNTFSSIQSVVFDRRCVAHHGANGDAGLDLRSAQSYNNLVNAQSTQTAMVLVSPGDPDASYLIHKLEGGGTIVGARMPIMGSFLTADETATIRRWIEEGAPNN